MYAQRRVQYKSERCQLLAFNDPISESNIHLSNAMTHTITTNPNCKWKEIIECFLKGYE